jgi:tRNA-2-methylthio-N6-dimethylallyladenosine synthase
VPPDVVAERYQRLVAVVERTAWAQSKRLVGGAVEVLIAEGEGRKDDVTSRLSGRARDNRLVHVAACDARPGDVVRAVVSYAAPHHLVADEVLDVRRTRGGDAWQARQESPAASGVLLGMPGMPKVDSMPSMPGVPSLQS